MSEHLRPKDAKIVKGRIEGKTSKEIAAEVYPDSKQGDALVRRRLQKQQIKDAVLAEMKRQGITLDQVIKPVAQALHAYKENKEGDAIVDHTVRMQASDRASKWLGLDKMHDTDPVNEKLSSEDLKRIADTSDEVKLTELLFKRNS